MKRILFVDDEQNVLDGIRRMMHPHRSRWEVRFAIGGVAALQLCSEASFDVVVTDLRMPGMDGAELLGHIRDIYPGTARIILSGYSEIALAARAVPVAYRVLAKPCDSTELQQTLDRVCTLQDVLCTPALRQLIGSLGELPSLSATYAALSDLFRKTDIPILEVSRIIEQDVAMTAKVLQIVNGGFFGLSREVVNIEFAVSYLGLETIRTLALYTETFRVFTPDARVPAAFWPAMQQHSQRTTAIVGTFGLTQKSREIAVIASLLHDVGTLVLASSMPDQFCSVLEEMSRTGASQAEVEETLLGISHAEVGAYLLGLWGINSVAVEAIAHHHHPTRISHNGLDCSAAVYLANLIAHEMDAHPDDLLGKELSDKDIKNLEALGLLGQFPAYRENALDTLVA